MKNKILMISTYFLSFVILIGSVNATCQELTCVYPKGTTQQAVKIVQDKECSLSLYRANNTLDSDSPSWTKFELPTEKINFKYITINENMQPTKNYYNEEDNTLLSCPTCLNYNNNIISKKIETYNKDDGDKKCKNGFVLLQQSSEESKTPEQISGEKDKSVIDKVNEYKMNYCKYSIYKDSSYVESDEGTVELYYNETSFHFSDGYDIKFTIEDIISSNDGSCPHNLYSSYATLKETFWVNDPGKLNRNRVWTLTSIERYNNNSDNNKTPSAPTNSCELFSDDAIKIIDDVMKVIRIAVPILLVVLGMTDFLRATFSDNEDNMKKDRDRFIKRIIAAIIVFIVPIFVNLVLNIANTVWGSINKETCIK